MNNILLALPLLFVLTATGCLSVPTRDRGSLSDAMDKAQNDNPEDRRVPDRPAQPDFPPPPPYQPEIPPYPDYPTEPAPGADSQTPTTVSGGMLFGVRGSFSGSPGANSTQAFDGDVLLGVNTKAQQFLLTMGLMGLTPQPGSNWEQSLQGNLTIFRLGGEIRLFPLKDWIAFSPHFDVGGGLFGSFWTFKNPLYAGTDTIYSDSLGGFYLNIGLGLDLVATDHFRLGLRATPEIYLFGATTGEGFTNDYFKPVGTLKLQAEVLIQ